MMSPAHASSASSRSFAWNTIALWTLWTLPVRGTVSRMPRVKWPDASRTNAMRSRCFGSMFAWILNTKPDDLRLGRRDRALARRLRARRRRELRDALRAARARRSCSRRCRRTPASGGRRGTSRDRTSGTARGPSRRPRAASRPRSRAAACRASDRRGRRSRCPPAGTRPCVRSIRMQLIAEQVVAAEERRGPCRSASSPA